MFDSFSIPMKNTSARRRLAITFDVISVSSKKGDLPSPPFLCIYVREFSKGENTGERPLISPQLMSDIEVDESINLLIQQLEKLRKKAKHKLASLKQEAKHQLKDFVAERGLKRMDD